MKKLSKFLKFDFGSFIKGKAFEISEIKLHYAYENGERKNSDGVTVGVVIIKDDTDYGDDMVTNKYEKFNVKCLGADLDQAEAKFSLGDVVRFTHYKKAVVYGSYRNQLSVEVGNLDSLQVVGSKGK